jgi:hypothetical protein
MVARVEDRMFRFRANGSVRWTGSHMRIKFVRTIVLRKIRQLRTNGAERVFRRLPRSFSRNCSVIR